MSNTLFDFISVCSLGTVAILFIKGLQFILKKQKLAKYRYANPKSKHNTRY